MRSFYLLSIFQDVSGDIQPDPDGLHDLKGVHGAEVVNELGPEAPGPVHLALGPQAPVVGHQLGPGGRVELQVFIWKSANEAFYGYPWTLLISHFSPETEYLNPVHFWLILPHYYKRGQSWKL